MNIITDSINAWNKIKGHLYLPIETKSQMLRDRRIQKEDILLSGLCYNSNGGYVNKQPDYIRLLFSIPGTLTKNEETWNSLNIITKKYQSENIPLKLLPSTNHQSNTGLYALLDHEEIRSHGLSITKYIAADIFATHIAMPTDYAKMQKITNHDKAQELLLELAKLYK